MFTISVQLSDYKSTSATVYNFCVCTRPQFYQRLLFTISVQVSDYNSISGYCLQFLCKYPTKILSAAIVYNFCARIRPQFYQRLLFTIYVQVYIFLSHLLYIICSVCNKCMCALCLYTWVSYAQWRNSCRVLLLFTHLSFSLFSSSYWLLYSNLSGRCNCASIWPQLYQRLLLTISVQVSDHNFTSGYCLQFMCMYPTTILSAATFYNFCASICLQFGPRLSYTIYSLPRLQFLLEYYLSLGI
jgi:hypothetical protein